MRSPRALAILLLILLAHQARAQIDVDPANPNAIPPAPLHEQIMHLSGDPDRPVDLIVTVYTPLGQGPFPLAVINHGVNGTKEKPADMPRERYSYIAYYFLSRGYAVALPMARGYGGSGGRQAHHGCELSEGALENGRDIAGVISSLGSDPQIDTTRTVVVGQSFGGWSTLGLAALNPPGVHGVVDFVGGIHTSACTPVMGGEQNGLVSGAARLGAATSLPSLWFYGENDSLFGPDIWRPMHQAYTQAGGQAELVDVGSFMDDSHQLLSHMESFPIWIPRLDAFLARIGLPQQNLFPAYLPIPLPAPTHFADIDDVNAVPWISDNNRALYRKFLTLGPTRVFLVAPGGQAVSGRGNFDPLAGALALCAQHHLTCRPYAIDGDVVWVPPASAPRPAATRYAPLNDAAAVPWVSANNRATYLQFLQYPLPRVYVVATGGQSLAIHGGEDPLGRAMALCQDHNLQCRPYAVDNDVVWVPPPPPPRAPHPTHFAAIDDITAVPWVTPQGRASYAHFLTVPLPRAFVIARGGQSAATQGGYDPLNRALAECTAHGLQCRPYAVNDAVVFNPASLP